MGLEAMAIAAVVGGGLMEAGGSIMGGNAANKKSKLEAAQLQSQANSVQGDAQREMLQLRQQQRLAQSDLIARAAAGGSSTTDAGIANLYGGIEAKGDYNALTALYNGDVRATGLRNQAAMSLYEGQQAKRASRIQAVSGLLKTAGAAASMGAKYGGGGNGLMAFDAKGNRNAGWFATPEEANAAATRRGITWNTTGGYR